MLKVTNKNKYIALIVTVAIILLSLLSLITDEMGLLGDLLRYVFFSLFGFAAYVFLTLGLYITINLFRKDKDILKDGVYIFILFISFIIVMDIYNNSTDTLSLLARTNYNLTLSKEGLGSGLVGGTFGYIFLKFFGKLGSYILVFCTVLISTLYLTDIDGKKIYEKFKGIIKENHIREETYESFSLKINTFKDRLVEFFEKIANRLRKKEEDLDEEVLNLKDLEGFDYTIIDDEEFSQSVTSQILKSDLQEMENTVPPEEWDTTDYSQEEEKKEVEKFSSGYEYPPISLLRKSQNTRGTDSRRTKEQAKIIEDTMKNFNIDSRVIKINRGPTITSFELELAPGIKVSRVLNLSDDLALALASSGIRIEAPIPGKSAIGIEVPNTTKDAVFLRDVLEDEVFKNIESDIPLVLGKDIAGESIISSIDKMPHLLIAGATGSGKSVCINTIIASIIYKSSPDEVKLLLVDPKVVELNVYNDIPHLLLPVVTSPKDSRSSLKWAVDEMERRYKLFADNNVRDIKSYNNLEDGEGLPKIVIIIDELSDLMMAAPREIEEYICRLAQMARASGIYLIIATQRPSVDVVTGVIKANIPSRISFAVSSQIDSRTILDTGGAEKLLGQGDMLFFPSNYSKPKRIQGAYVSDREIVDLVNFLKTRHEINYDQEVIKDIQENIEMGNKEPRDELFDEAIQIAVREEKISASMLQRRLRIGYNRAASMIDFMEDNNYIGTQDGNKAREVLITEEDLNNII